MVVLLFTAIFIFGLLALTLYFWAPRGKQPEELLPPPPGPPRSFIDEPTPAQLPAPETFDRAPLIERAQAGDKSVLSEAHKFGDREFYDELLDQLTSTADRQQTLFALVSYVTRHELPVNKKLAEAAITFWKDAPTRSATATSLHLAALTDDAGFYQETVETALRLWRQGSLPEVSAAELKSVFDGEFWVLSTQTRGSGAGFLLKRTLANARRELENSRAS
jgi:hypothetical protein